MRSISDRACSNDTPGFEPRIDAEVCEVRDGGSVAR